MQFSDCWQIIQTVTYVLTLPQRRRVFPALLTAAQQLTLNREELVAPLHL